MDEPAWVTFFCVPAGKLPERLAGSHDVGLLGLAGRTVRRKQAGSQDPEQQTHGKRQKGQSDGAPLNPDAAGAAVSSHVPNIRSHAPQCSEQQFACQPPGRPLPKKANECLSQATRPAKLSNK